MKFNNWQQALCALGLATAVVLPAQAVTITFENVLPGTLLFPGEAVVQQGYSVAAGDSFAVVDTSAAFGPGVGFDLAGPYGNLSQFFIGLNDTYASLTKVGGGSFRVAGFDFGFVSAFTNLFAPGEIPGLMVAAYESADGVFGLESWFFANADAAGKFPFQTAGLGDMGALANGVRWVEFFACTANNVGQCANPNVNFSQFALDNIRIPEPGSLALAGLGLALAMGLRRRSA